MRADDGLKFDELYNLRVTHLPPRKSLDALNFMNLPGVMLGFECAPDVSLKDYLYFQEGCFRHLEYSQCWVEKIQLKTTPQGQPDEDSLDGWLEELQYGWNPHVRVVFAAHKESLPPVIQTLCMVQGTVTREKVTVMRTELQQVNRLRKALLALPGQR